VGSALRFYLKVANNTLPADTEKKTPLCMTQYGRVFATTRIPHPTRDAVYSWTGVRHIVVLRKCQFFHLQVISPDGQVAAEAQIQNHLEAIIREADQPGADQSYPAIGALTSEDRDRWSSTRQELVRLHSTNVASLEAIDRALFVLVLEDKAPADIDASARLFLHGDVRKRWFDKLQFIICANGVAGVNMEHTPIDGHTILRLLTEIHNEILARNGQVLVDGPSVAPPRYLHFQTCFVANFGGSVTHGISGNRRLDWIVPVGSSVSVAIHDAKVHRIVLFLMLPNDIGTCV